MKAPQPLVFCLYLAGNTPVSARAVVNTRRFCEEHLEGRYELEIVDISLHPDRVRGTLGPPHSSQWTESQLMGDRM